MSDSRIPRPPIPRLPYRPRAEKMVICLLLLIILMAGVVAAYLGGTP